MSASKTYILTTVPNRLGNLEIQELQRTNPAFRGTGKSLLGIRPALTTTNVNREPVSIEIKVENQLSLSGSENESQSNIRKRQRLDHLTMEEKLMRRKLKNRVAAQTARDRKKARMDELEDMVSALEKDVEHLKSENSRLQNVTMLLETENKFLKERLDVSEQLKKEVTVVPPVVIKQEIEEVPRKSSSVDSVEQAWPISAPQPKEQELTTQRSRWTTPLNPSWNLLLMTLMIYWTSYNSAAQTCSVAELKKTLQNLTPSQRKSLLANAESLRKLPQWWGPQQKSWNPSKN